MSEDQSIVLFLFECGLVVGPHLGYVIQGYSMYQDYQKIIINNKNNHNNVENPKSAIKGYAALVSFILLVSNTLRIFYFFGNQFATALFFQSIFAVLTHLLLILFVLFVNNNNNSQNNNNNTIQNREEEEPKESSYDHNYNNIHINIKEADAEEKLNYYCLFQFSPKQFFTQYCFYVATFSFFYFSFLIVSLTMLGATNKIENNNNNNENKNFLLYTIVVEGVGYAALGIEALLVAPQIIKNHKNKSTDGLTLFLILSWAGGDVIKMIYFIFLSQPLPFLLCGIFQLCLDFIVLLQFFTLPRNNHNSENNNINFENEIQIPIDVTNSLPQNNNNNNNNNKNVLDELFEK